MDSVALAIVCCVQLVVILALLARIVPKPKTPDKPKKEEKKPVGHFGGRP